MQQACGLFHQRFAQRQIGYGHGLVANDVFLAQPLSPDDVFRHVDQITSASVLSLLRNCRTPNQSSKAMTAALVKMLGQLNSLCPRKMHQRNPSMMPTMGFRLKISRQFPGTIFELNPTGETYSPS